MKRRSYGPILGVCALAAALWLLMHHLRAYKLGDVWREIQTFPGPALLLSGLLVVLNIPVIIYLDVLAVRWLHRLLAYRRIALVSFLSAAFGRTVGFPIFTGGGLRYRFYRPWGFSLKEVGQLTTFYFASLWLGFLAWAGATLTLQPLRIQADWAEKLPSLRFVGVLLLAGLAGYLFLSLRRKPLRLFGFEVPQVPLGLALGRLVYLCSNGCWMRPRCMCYCKPNPRCPFYPSPVRISPPKSFPFSAMPPAVWGCSILPFFSCLNLAFPRRPSWEPWRFTGPYTTSSP